MADKNLKKAADKILKEAYGKYYASIYKFCLSRLKNDVSNVEDCVQETYLVFYNKLLSGEEIEYVQAYLFKIADNLVKKQLSRLKRQAKTVDIDEVREIITHSVDIDDRLSFEEYSKMISDALSDTDGEIFILRYIEGYQINEIAQRLNMSVSNVSTRLSRMREKIRNVINNSE